MPFEWYSEWAQLRPLLRAAVGADAPGDAAAKPDCPAGGRVLVVGCGNSELSAQMYDDGFVDITNIDFSKARPARVLVHAQQCTLAVVPLTHSAAAQVCIASMMGKHVRERPKMRWLVMDATAMKVCTAPQLCSLACCVVPDAYCTLRRSSRTAASTRWWTKAHWTR